MQFCMDKSDGQNLSLNQSKHRFLCYIQLLSQPLRLNIHNVSFTQSLLSEVLAYNPHLMRQPLRASAET